MKLLVSVNKKELSEYLEFTDSFIIGLKDFSVNYFEVSLEEIEELLRKYSNINLFIAINKNIFNNDLNNLEENLIKLEKLNIKGIMFYDLSVLSIVKRLKLNLDLVYHQSHMVTNYNIINFYEKEGVKYAYLSTEITEDEMSEISSKTNIPIIAMFIGHIIISHSKRKLVSNYYQHINRNNNHKINTINEKNKDKKYIILETSEGTNILTNDILNGTKAFINLKEKIEYGVLDNNLIDDEMFLNILKLYKNNLDNTITDKELIDSTKDLIGNYDGFFYTKTIYKVK